MFFDQEVVQLHYPDFEQTILSPNEIEELLPIFESPKANSNSGSEGSNRSVYSVEERKLRRMKSNRESARRSRWRKKRYVEKLTEELGGLKLKNQYLKNRLGSALSHCQALWRENERLKSESAVLGATLSDLCYALKAMNAMQQQQHQLPQKYISMLNH